jgi:hypothetical protein
VAFVLGLRFRSIVEPFANHLPMRGGDGYFVLMGISLCLGAFSLGMCVWYLLTSPAQNAEFIDRAARRGRSLPKNFDRSIFDPSHPDYSMKTLLYLWRKLASRRAG